MTRGKVDIFLKCGFKQLNNIKNLHLTMKRLTNLGLHNDNMNKRKYEIIQRNNKIWEDNVRNLLDPRSNYYTFTEHLYEGLDEEITDASFQP